MSTTASIWVQNSRPDASQLAQASGKLGAAPSDPARAAVGRFTYRGMDRLKLCAASSAWVATLAKPSSSAKAA